jgi:hypothetical protein
MGVYEDLKTALATVQRLSALENRFSDYIIENRKALADMRADIAEVRERQARIEQRLDGQEDILTSRAQAAAATASAATVGATIAGLAERIALLEAGAPRPGGRLTAPP